MSLIRNVGDLKLPALPPSPIPTGKGSRSAGNEILSEYLAKSLHVPELSLPEPHIPANTDRALPAINYRSLKTRDRDAKGLLLRSAREFGAFRLTCHGISCEELQSLVKEADQVFAALELTDVDKEKITWASSADGRMEWARDVIREGRCRDSSEANENIAMKLHTIAQHLCELFVEDTEERQYGQIIHGQESVLSLYRYKHRNNLTPRMEEKSKSCDYVLYLHLPTRKSRFYVQSPQGRLCFEADPDTIVISLGKHMEEWSKGDFRCVSEEVVCKPHQQGSQASFSIELKCRSSNIGVGANRNCGTISIRDQMLIGLLLFFLYDVIWLFSFS